MKSGHEYTISLFSALFCSHVSVFTLEQAAEDGLSVQWTVTPQWASLLFFLRVGGLLESVSKGAVLVSFVDFKVPLLYLI